MSIKRVGLIALFAFVSVSAQAAKPVITMEIINHLFVPDVITVPANTKVKLVIYNRDSTPEEFESYELNREKVVLGQRKISVFIGPLAVGEYPFFGEFNPKTAQGKVVVRDE